jgi:hypothetical protein
VGSWFSILQGVNEGGGGDPQIGGKGLLNLIMTSGA